MAEKRIKRLENTPICTRLRKETIEKLSQIKQDFGIDKATFIRKCIEAGVKKPAMIIKKH